MKSKSLMLMILSMGFGLIAAVGISQVMGRNKGPQTHKIKKGPVLVAMDHLDNKTLLTKKNCKLEQWPVEIIPENAATSFDQITDKALTIRLTKGLPIILDDIVPKSELAPPIPPGFKVAGIKASGDNLSGLISPGDLVDVIGIFSKRSRDGQVQTISKTFLKALRVYAVDSKMRAEVGERVQGKGTGGSVIVSVLVTEKQAEALVYVQKEGTLKLVMRGGAVDDADEHPHGLGLAAFDFAKPKQKGDGSESQPEKKDETPIIVEPAPQKKYEVSSMVIWNGNEPENFTFHNGALARPPYRQPDQPSYRPPSQPPVSPPVAKDSGQEESISFEGNTRRFDEDQYRGE